MSPFPFRCLLAVITVFAGVCVSGEAATLTFRGGLDYNEVTPANPVRRMGITWIQLSFDQPGHIDYTTRYILGDYFRVGLFIGTQEHLSGPVLDPRWFQELGEVSFVATSSGDVPAGDYLLAIWGENTEWDWRDNGYTGSMPIDGGLDIPGTPAFQLAVNGDFRPVSIWEGRPDGSFRITNLPEPGVAGLSVGAAIVLSMRRRRWREQ